MSELTMADFADCISTEPGLGEEGYTGDILELREYPCNCFTCRGSLTPAHRPERLARGDVPGVLATVLASPRARVVAPIARVPVVRRAGARDAMRTVAALYIDPRGPYPKMPGVDPWDEQRDARLYMGPHPVVAHPPCGPWGSMARYSSQDPDLAPHAVEQVRAWGGVLEHPARSRLWRELELPRPGELPDAFGGVAVEVFQVDWGHVALKRTWLYLVGISGAAIPRVPEREPTHWISGSRKPRAIPGAGGVAPAHVKFCSNQQRRRTPPAFAEMLVELARQAAG